MIIDRLNQIIEMLGGTPDENKMLYTEKADEAILAEEGTLPTADELIGTKLDYIMQLVNAENASDNLHSSKLKAIINALGGQVDDVTDNLTESLLIGIVESIGQFVTTDSTTAQIKTAPAASFKAKILSVDSSVETITRYSKNLWPWEDVEIPLGQATALRDVVIPFSIGSISLKLNIRNEHEYPSSLYMRVYDADDTCYELTLAKQGENVYTRNSLNIPNVKHVTLYSSSSFEASMEIDAVLFDIQFEKSNTHTSFTAYKNPEKKDAPLEGGLFRMTEGDFLDFGYAVPSVVDFYYRA